MNRPNDSEYMASRVQARTRQLEEGVGRDGGFLRADIAHRAVVAQIGRNICNVNGYTSTARWVQIQEACQAALAGVRLIKVVRERYYTRGAHTGDITAPACMLSEEEAAERRAGMARHVMLTKATDTPQEVIAEYHRSVRWGPPWNAPGEEL